MESIDLTIDPNHEIFNSIIRDKLDFLSLTIKVLEVFLNRYSESDKVTIKTADYLDQVGFGCVNDKMRRIFLITPKKYVSFHFPFDIASENLKFGFCLMSANTSGKFKIDLSVLSYLREVIHILRQDSNMDAIVEVIWEADQSLKIDFGSIFNYMILMEDGYIRYDYDTENENGDFHPIHHLDIFYGQNTTFKIGLKDKMTPSSMHNLLDIKQKCNYLS